MRIIGDPVRSQNLPSCGHHYVSGESVILRASSDKEDRPLLLPADWTRRHSLDLKFSRPLRLPFDADQGYDKNMPVEINQSRHADFSIHSDIEGSPPPDPSDFAPASMKSEDVPFLTDAIAPYTSALHAFQLNELSPEGTNASTKPAIRGPNWTPNHDDTAKYLRRTMQIEPHYPLDLSIIPEPPPGQQPDQPIHKLLQLAIFGSPQHMLTAEEIYKAMEARFEWYRLNKSSGPKIRHTLSLYKIFQRVKRIGLNKGNYWTLDTSNGDGTYKKQRSEKIAKHPIEGAVKQIITSLREDGRLRYKRSKREGIIQNKLDNCSMRSPRRQGRRETFIRGSTSDINHITDNQEASSMSRQHCLVDNKIQANSLLSNNSPHIDGRTTSRSRAPSWQSDIESFGTQRYPSLSLASHNSPYLVEDLLVPVESFTKTGEVSSLSTGCYADIVPRRQSGTDSSFPIYYAPSIHMISPPDGVRLPPITGGNDTGTFPSSFDVSLPPLRDVMRGVPSPPGSFSC
ncbi:hypothetical protein PILCRDRAFT_444660 [Piloderma croceum F 1598]|uniref:Fork-head domain-containing protein n=1 Tax=Piloderma croceum (strain F 1598) TaxID=765440 RepID=A0A0C3C1H3_PILCF|nr:hypothetical protein PILCRDRAFT_444660 [Piloderma croceum F 1598]